MTIEIIVSVVNIKNHATEFLLGEHPIAKMPPKLLFTQHPSCAGLKQKYLITMHIFKVRINLPCSNTRAWGASETNNIIRIKGDAKEHSEKHSIFVGGGYYFVAYIKFESALAIK